MTLRYALERVLTEYPEAKAEPFREHRTGDLLRRGLPKKMEEALGEAGVGLRFRGSAGRSLWAAVPWAALFDPRVTERPTEGYYVVYLFHASKPVVHLSLLSGTVRVRTEFGNAAPAVLRERAERMRERLTDYAEALSVSRIELGSANQLPADYEASHAIGLTYALSALPPELALRRDLQTIVAAYRAFTSRGGFEERAVTPPEASSPPR